MSSMNATQLAEQYPASYLAEYNGNVLINTAVVFIVLQTFFIVLRFISRRIVDIPFGWDDLLVVLGYIVSIAVDAISIAMITQGGSGVHQVVQDLYPEKIVIFVKLRLAASTVYLPGVVLPKLAILMIYYRIFQTPFVRWGCWIVAAILILNLIGNEVAEGLACRPISMLWDPTQKGECVDIFALYEWASFPNIVTDAMMMILPLPSIWRLQLTRNAKIGLTLIFLTGSIGIVASCIRFVIFSQVNAFSDAAWNSTRLMIWTIVECGVYLIAACLCTLKPLARKAKSIAGQSYKLSDNPISKTTTFAGNRTRAGSDDLAELKGDFAESVRETASAV